MPTVLRDGRLHHSLRGRVAKEVEKAKRTVSSGRLPHMWTYWPHHGNAGEFIRLGLSQVRVNTYEMHIPNDFSHTVLFLQCHWVVIDLQINPI